MRATTVAVTVFVAGSLIVAKNASHGNAAAAKTVVAGVELRPEGGSGVRGAGFFRQRDTRLSGWVVVWHVPPRSRHAVHFHGPGRCGGPPADAIAAHADLVADGRGVAFRRFSVPVRGTILRRDVYYNVHRRGASDGMSPSIACGDVRPEDDSG